MLIDKFVYKNDNIFKKSLIVGTFFSSIYLSYKYMNKNDLRIKERRCNKELSDFGECFDKNNDNRDKCNNLLEAYRKCLQNSYK